MFSVRRLFRVLGSTNSNCPVDALQGVTNLKRACLQVDVIPAKTERLALAKAHGYGDRVKRLEAMPMERIQQGSDLIGCEWLDLERLGTGWLHHRCHIPGHEPPPKRLIEGCAEDSMYSAGI
jgi:hypothetical protein